MSDLPRRFGIRDLGYAPGIHSPGPRNSILDVPGVHISQLTIPTSSPTPAASTARKGVTIICPRAPQDFYKPCHAATFTFNGNGELTGSRQIADWGFTNTPIAFTNSFSLGSVIDGVWDWVLERQQRMGWRDLDRARQYGTPVVGETADWLVNCEVVKSRVGAGEVARAFEGLKSAEMGGEVLEGQFGGGAGMTCVRGGTGTASRKVGGPSKEYTLGVLVQTNYGHLIDLTIGGVPVGKILKREKDGGAAEGQGTDVHASGTTDARKVAGRTQDGSILVLIITDAPLASHQLNRVARHATVGLSKVGSYGVGRTFSGDIFLALSTADHGPEQLVDAELQHMNPTQTYKADVVKNESIDPYFYACAEAVEEAILNSLVGGREGVVGMDGTRVEGLPVDRVKEILDRYLVRA